MLNSRWTWSTREISRTVWSLSLLTGSFRKRRSRDFFGGSFARKLIGGGNAMKMRNLTLLMLAAGISARADFSYTMTPKSVGAAPAAGAQQIKYTLKGQKMMVETGGHTMLVDFDAQTVTDIDNGQKTYSVKKFSDLAQGMPAAEIQVDAKETGQRKVINGFNSTELVLTVQ